MKRKLAWLLLAAAVFAADRVVKVLARNLPEQGVVLIPGILQLRHTENPGIAFSLLSGVPWLPAVLGIAVLAAAFWFLRKKQLAPWPTAGLMLMLGGALGNLADRLFSGTVTDMIELLFVRFAVFNVADACLTVGCAVVIISLLFRPKDWSVTNPCQQPVSQKTDQKPPLAARGGGSKSQRG